MSVYSIQSNGSCRNNKAAEITQYSPEEAMGKDLVLEFISADSQQSVNELLGEALNGAEKLNFEFPLMSRNGNRIEVILNAIPRYDAFSKVVGVMGIGEDITGRLLQEQEYSRLIDSANAPIFGVSATGAINIWNKKAAEITEYTAKEVMGKNLVSDYITKEYQDSVGSVLREALNGVVTSNFVFPLITRAGLRIEILLNATPQYDAHQNVVGVVGIGQDITERIQQEQEYMRLIDFANAPIFGVARDGSINIWNKKAADITLYSPSEALGKNLVEDYISPDYQRKVDDVLSRALNGIETSNFEFPLLTKADRRVQILLNATPRYDVAGNVTGVVGIGQDITERMAQEQEYVRLIDTANAPIFGVKNNGSINIWNRKAADITQYPSEEVMGKNLVTDFITDDYQESVAEVLAQAFRGIETSNFEFPLITKTGRRVEILLNATPRYDVHGNIVGVVGIGQDITERIAQEQEYVRLIDTANAPIFGVDTSMRVNIWNRKAADITQYSADEVMGKNLVTDFITEDYQESVAGVLAQAFQGIETSNYEFPLMTKANRRVQILLNATSRYDVAGNVVGGK